MDQSNTATPTLFSTFLDEYNHGCVSLSSMFCPNALSGPRLGLENELRIEREQRQALQKALQREQDNSVELRTQLQQLEGLHGVSVA